jgi:hypothetical protein
MEAGRVINFACILHIAYKRLYSPKKPLFYVNFNGYTRFDKLFRFSGAGTVQLPVRLWTGTVNSGLSCCVARIGSGMTGCLPVKIPAFAGMTAGGAYLHFQRSGFDAASNDTFVSEMSA